MFFIDKKKILDFVKDWWFLFLFLLIYFVAANILIILRFRQFEVFYFDHGYFDDAIWKVSRFSKPMVDHLWGNDINQLGDHFTPIMYLLSLVYLLTSSYEIIFILGNVFIVLSAFVMFLIAKDKIKSKLMVFACIFAYLLFVGMQNVILFSFHTEQIALLTLSLFFYFFEKKNFKLYWLFLIITLLSKETLITVFICFGIYEILSKKKKLGVYTILFSLFYYFLVVRLIIPMISGSSYYYASNFYSFKEMFIQFFYPFIKTKTILVSFATFGFLPLLNFAFLPVILQDYFLRFVLNSASTRWDLGLHYNAIISILMTYSSIITVYLLSKKSLYKKFIKFHAVLIILFVIIYHQFFYHGPLGMVYNKVFYSRTKDFDFLNRLLLEIPKTDELIMTANNIAPHLTHNYDLILFRDKYWERMPKIVIADTRQGQDWNNFFPLNGPAFYNMIARLENDPNYQIKKISGEQSIFIKKDEINMSWYEQFKKED